MKPLELVLNKVPAFSNQTPPPFSSSGRRLSFCRKNREKRSGMDLGQILPNISVAPMQADERRTTVQDQAMRDDGSNVLLVWMAIGASRPSMQRMITYTCRISMYFCYYIHAICPDLSYMRFVAVRTLPWVAFAAHITLNPLLFPASLRLLG